MSDVSRSFIAFSPDFFSNPSDRESVPSTVKFITIFKKVHHQDINDWVSYG
ncbi:hypothetical protein VL20_3293 [Microcystis panniformis FACHB-1757]|uniref:Uncharacterized protein n=1 Tax=Microcystis panniformis FACHB-1757 TaxID=1638788 RepID=A0A0K1S2S5_9CHRO|nr:hypothetical protein VL20_3293 [Microcystis panniformis FACHB-1757]